MLRTPFWRRYGWLINRLWLAALTVFLVSFVVYLATILLPGDAAQAVLGRNPTPEALEAMREKLGLNEPPLLRYLAWTGGLFAGDFGTSLVTGTPVLEMIGPRVVNTLLLVALTALIAVPLAFIIGISAGTRSNGAWDGFVNIVSIVLAGLPEFVIAILLLILFSTGLFQWFPAITILAQGQQLVTDPMVLVLPVTTLVLITLPYLIRQMRASLIENLSSDYVAMAELKGLPNRVVVFRHALRNSLVPAIQATALSLAFLIGGSVVIEFLFQYPGMGLALTTSVSQRDVPVLQFIVIVIAAGYVVFNLIADVLTVLVTPKERTR